MKNEKYVWCRIVSYITINTINFCTLFRVFYKLFLRYLLFNNIINIYPYFFPFLLVKFQAQDNVVLKVLYPNKLDSILL